MALYRGSTKLSGIGRVPGTEYMTQATYDALPSSKLTDNVNRGIYTDNEDTTLEKFIKNGVEYCLGGGGVKSGTVDVLIVGGGGGGASGYRGAGGGGGGFIECSQYPIFNNNLCYQIDVGDKGYSGLPGTNGGDSCAFGLTAYGGGGGGNNANGSNGGSGGGGAGCTSRLGGYGCPGQGNNGGAGGYESGGGGGGAGTAGCCADCGGTGGDGKCSCISGELQWYSGGGGSMVGSSTYTCGGCGGGCWGQNMIYCGGGGPAGPNNSERNKGGNGVVIIRYKTDGSCGIKNTSYGGTKYTCGDYTIHCFCNVGTDYFIPVFK